MEPPNNLETIGKESRPKLSGKNSRWNRSDDSARRQEPTAEKKERKKENRKATDIIANKMVKKKEKKMEKYQVEEIQDGHSGLLSVADSSVYKV